MRQAFPLNAQSLCSVSNLPRKFPHICAHAGRPAHSLSLHIIPVRLFNHSSTGHRRQIRQKDVLARAVSCPWSKAAGTKGRMSEVEAHGTAGVRVAVEGCVRLSGCQDFQLLSNFPLQGHGTLHAIYASVDHACQIKGWDGVDLLIIGGDFQVSAELTWASVCSLNSGSKESIRP